jgi:hypothetical protein
MSYSYKGKADGICFSTSDCEKELYCALTDKKKRGKCAARLAENAQCDSHKDCVDSLFCEGADKDKQGKCAKRKEDGGVCTSSNDCLSASFCRSAGEGGVCVSQKDRGKKQDAGGVCVSHFECKPELHCSQVKPRELGKCAPRKLKDESCKTGHGMCLTGLYCKGPVVKNPRDTEGKCATKPEAKKRTPPTPTANTKPVTETKPAVDTKPATETKPTTETKPLTDTKPTTEIKPAATTN